MDNATVFRVGDSAETYSLADMLQANETDEGMCEWLRAAAPGDSLADGEGVVCEVAHPCIVVTPPAAKVSA